MSRKRNEKFGDLHATVYGPELGSPRGAVVLVHGVCTSSKVFERWAPRIAERGLEAWCLDLRGHGQSKGHEDVGQFHMADYAEDVEACIERSQGQAVVGHDMGGLLAQQAASRRPLKGIALINSFAPKGLRTPTTLAELWREIRPRYVHAAVRGNSWKPARADVLSFMCKKLPADEQDDVLELVQPESGQAMRELATSGVEVPAKAIICPVLVVACTFDTFTPPQKQRLIARRYSADYVEFAQHSHMPMVEPGFERPIAVVGRWLEEVARVGEQLKASAARLSLKRQRAVAQQAAAAMGAGEES